MIRGGSGEAVQLMLQGEGFVIVRPSEVDPAEGHSSTDATTIGVPNVICAAQATLRPSPPS